MSTGPINQQLIQQYINQINAINPADTKACQYLNGMLANIEKDIQAKIQSALSQIAILKILTEIPTDLNGVINWIKGVVNIVVGPYAQAIAAEIALVEKLVELTELIASKSSQFSCNIQIPATPTIPTLPIAPIQNPIPPIE